MSIRLNKDHREFIANKAKQMSPNNKQLDAHREKGKELGEKLRIEALGGHDIANKYEGVRKQLENIRNTLPDNLLSHTIGICLAHSIFVKNSSGGYRYGFPLPEVAVYSGRLLDAKESAYYEQIEDYIHTEEKLRKQLQEVRDTVYASIEGITTLKKLLETWPEVKELLPDELTQPKVSLPAMQTKKLNTMVGLPTNKKETNKD